MTAIIALTIQKLRKILVPLDGSKNSLRGLDMAVSQAQMSSASITVIYVFPHRYEMYYWSKNVVSNEFKKTASKIMKVARTHIKNDIRFHEKVVEGPPGPKIIKYAQDNKVNLIVMGAHGSNLMKETFLGSTSHYVVQKSKIPVLVVK